MKLQLAVETGTLSGRVFDLETGFLTVGRGETCSVRFDPQTERIASKQHAFIEARADGFYVTDNDSTNGTFLNGNRVTSAKLNSGDRLQFGSGGATASVRIDAHQPRGADRSVSTIQENFRDHQIQQFNQTAAHEPAGIQASLHNFGLGSLAPVSEPEKAGSRNHLGVVVVVTIFVFLLLVVSLLVSSSLSPSEEGEITLNLAGVIFAVMASFVAFIPAVIYILPLIWLDRYDPEPLWLLALAFAWGALVSVIVSFVINTSVGYVAFRITGDPYAAQAIGAVISAPVVEEASKGIGLLILLIFFRRYFDDILDGIVYAGVIALGFATVENVLYYGRAIGEAGMAGLAILFVMRGIMSPFAHVTFTAMTGIGCGMARESHNRAVKILMPMLGYVGAVTLHALWNGMAVIGGLGGFLLGYLILEIPFFFIFIIFSLIIMLRQNRILKEMLAIDIARGLIPQDHARKATSAFRSSGWLLSGLFEGKFKARSRYVRAIGKLGLSYWHIQRATAAQGHTGSFQQNPILRDEVLRWRDKV